MPAIEMAGGGRGVGLIACNVNRGETRIARRSDWMRAGGRVTASPLQISTRLMTVCNLHERVLGFVALAKSFSFAARGGVSLGDNST